MHVTIQIRVDALSDEQTLSCLKEALTSKLSVQEAMKRCTAFDVDEGTPPPIVYACYPTLESLALFTLPGDGIVEYVLEFVRPSNDTLRTLTEDTLKRVDRQVKRTAGKFKFVRARLQDRSSLGTAVEALPLRWRDRLRNSIIRRDLVDKGLIVGALGVLTWVFTGPTEASWFGGVGVGVSLAVSIVQATLPGNDIEWSVR